MTQTFLRRTGGERGTALLEMAMTLPLLLLVAIGIFEFGRAFQTWEVLTNAAREGARIAVLPSSTEATVQNRTKDYLNAGQLAGDNASILVTPTTISIGGADASATKVTINYPYQFMILQPVARLVVRGSQLGQPITMSASAEMRNESPF